MSTVRFNKNIGKRILKTQNSIEEQKKTRDLLGKN